MLVVKRRPSAKMHAKIVDDYDFQIMKLRHRRDEARKKWLEERFALCTERNTLQADLKKTERARDLAQKTLTVAELSISNLEDQRDALEDEIELLEAIINSYWELLKEKQTHIREQDREIEELAEELAEGMKGKEK